MLHHVRDIDRCAEASTDLWRNYPRLFKLAEPTLSTAAGAELHPAEPVASRTLASSNYLRVYQMFDGRYPDWVNLCMALRRLQLQTAAHSTDKQWARQYARFQNDLLSQRMRNSNFDKDIGYPAEHLWLSPCNIDAPAHSDRLCSIVNAVIREDDPACIADAV